MLPLTIVPAASPDLILTLYVPVEPGRVSKSRQVVCIEPNEQNQQRSPFFMLFQFPGRSSSFPNSSQFSKSEFPICICANVLMLNSPVAKISNRLLKLNKRFFINHVLIIVFL